MARNTINDDFCSAKNELGICFGYSTALEIFRCVDISKLAFARGDQLNIPDKPPQNRFLISAGRKIALEYPLLHMKRPLHVLIKEHARHYSTNLFTSHAFHEPIKYGALQQLCDSILVSSPSLAFFQIAVHEKDFMALLQLGFELCGTYQTTRTGVDSAYQVSPLTSVQALCDFAAQNPSSYGIKKVRKVLRYLADGSASPRETKLALVLGLPMSYGGYGLGIPCMNFEVETSSAALIISGRKHLRCDLCWPKAKLDVEYQSREMHEGEMNRIKDSRRANALAAMGWKCINITNDEFDSMYAMDTIAETIRKHLGKRGRVRVSDYHLKKLRLRRQLGLIVGNE